MDAKKRGMNMDRQDEQDFQELKTENFVMEVPKGRKAIARGVSPGGSRRNMSQAPKGRHRHGCIPVAGTESGSCGTRLGKHPLPAGEGRGEGENIASTKKHSAVSTLIRPAATFSPREKECGHSIRVDSRLKKPVSPVRLEFPGGCRPFGACGLYWQPTRG